MKLKISIRNEIDFLVTENFFLMKNSTPKGLCWLLIEIESLINFQYREGKSHFHKNERHELNDNVCNPSCVSDAMLQLWKEFPNESINWTKLNLSQRAFEIFAEVYKAATWVNWKYFSSIQEFSFSFNFFNYLWKIQELFDLYSSFQCQFPVALHSAKTPMHIMKTDLKYLHFI